MNKFDLNTAGGQNGKVTIDIRIQVCMELLYTVICAYHMCFSTTSHVANQVFPLQKENA